jgi:amino acid adenylation domain-containing protein
MKLLHETLKGNVDEYSEKNALIFKDKTLSYRALDQISSQMAFLCMEKGAGVGDRIGIYIDKSIDSIIAIFGILKTGACYVPLDPLAPLERQNLIVNDCDLQYLVTTSVKLRQVRTIAAQSKGLKHVFVLDKRRKEDTLNIPGIKMYFRDDMSRLPVNSPVVSEQLTPDSLAYILYTSGSTGQPKGVMLSHRAALAFVEWSYRTFSMVSDDIVSSHAPLHFDLSIFDIFVSIRAGATICLVPQGWSAFPRSIVDFIEQKRITTWYSVPSILTQLVLYGNLEERKFPALRQILFAGEVFPSKYLRKLMELIPDADYYNLYGPTETNVITYHHVKEAPKADTTIPIGLLCDNVRSFIVSDSGSIVKEGETGELYVECPTLMEGYWNDKKKTQEALKSNPYDPSADNMVYRTGDLVHWNEKGILEYHGRRDAMIKSRGYRIELGEVETALSAHPGLREAAVTAVPDDRIGNIIKAVIVPKSGEEAAEKDIKLFCAKKLPDYMVPEIISIVDALPRTSTGKIDRKKLSGTNL